MLNFFEVWVSCSKRTRPASDSRPWLMQHAFRLCDTSGVVVQPYGMNLQTRIPAAYNITSSYSAMRPIIAASYGQVVIWGVNKVLQAEFGVTIVQFGVFLPAIA